LVLSCWLIGGSCGLCHEVETELTGLESLAVGLGEMPWRNPSSPLTQKLNTEQITTACPELMFLQKSLSQDFTLHCISSVIWDNERLENLYLTTILKIV